MQAWSGEIAPQIREKTQAKVIYRTDHDVKTYAIVKVGWKTHLEELIRGKLRFRALNFYRGLEQEGQRCHDPNEGIAAVYQANNIQVVFGNQDGSEARLDSSNGLVGTVKAFLNNPTERVICFHAIHAGKWSHKEIQEDELPQFRKHLEINPSMNEFGDHVWVIHNVNKMMERVISAIKKNHFALKADLVHYYDLEKIDGQFSEDLIGLVKDKRFDQEREYRIVVDANSDSPDPLCLDVGDLTDIGAIFPLVEFNEKFEVKFR